MTTQAVHSSRCVICRIPLEAHLHLRRCVWTSSCSTPQLQVSSNTILPPRNTQLKPFEELWLPEIRGTRFAIFFAFCFLPFHSGFPGGACFDFCSPVPMNFTSGPPPYVENLNMSEARLQHFGLCSPTIVISTNRTCPANVGTNTTAFQVQSGCQTNSVSSLGSIDMSSISVAVETPADQAPTPPASSQSPPPFKGASFSRLMTASAAILLVLPSIFVLV